MKHIDMEYSEQEKAETMDRGTNDYPVSLVGFSGIAALNLIPLDWLCRHSAASDKLDENLAPPHFPAYYGGT